MNTRKTIRSFVIGCGLFLLGAAHADTLTVTSGQTVTIDSAQTYDAVSMSGGTIVLSAGGVLTTAGGVESTAEGSTIRFDGGKLISKATIKASGSGKLALVGNDGDIQIDFDCASWGDCFTSTSKAISLTGNRKLVLAIKGRDGMAFGSAREGLSLAYTGRTEIHSGYLTDYYTAFPKGEMFVSGTATLNIGGTWVEFASLSGPGLVDGDAGGQLTLNVPAGSSGKCFSSVAGAVALIKKGSGALEVFGRLPDDFSVTAGSVRAVTRGQAGGYSEFKLKVDGVGTSRKTGMQLNELAIFSDETDVTAGYEKTSFDSAAGYNGGKIFDKNDGTKWWYEYSMVGGAVFDKAWVTVAYPERRLVTGYKLKTSDSGGDRPRSWRLYGRDPGGEWELLDQREDEATVSDYDNTWTPLYAVTDTGAQGKVAGKVVSLAAGTSLTVDQGVSFCYESLADEGAAVVVNGALVKSGNGTSDVWSAVGGTPEAICVASGTLAFHSPLSFKFWKLAIGDVYDISGGEVTAGEIAVYDAQGNRLNVIGSPTFASYTVGSFSDSQSKLLYDGEDSTQGWIYSSGLNPSDESTWKWTAFTLNETAPAVSSYNLETASYGSPANGSPKTWKLYAKANAADEWTLIDSQSNVTVPKSSYSWYNGGKPWRVSSDSASGSAFPAGTPVSVAPGATLDLTQAAQTVLSCIELDGDVTGFGTIRGGSCAANGIVRVTYADTAPTGTYALPLKFENTSGLQNVETWTLWINGRQSRKHLAVTVDGLLAVKPNGMVLIFR